MSLTKLGHQPIKILIFGSGQNKNGIPVSPKTASGYAVGDASNFEATAQPTKKKKHTPHKERNKGFLPKTHRKKKAPNAASYIKMIKSPQNDWNI